MSAALDPLLTISDVMAVLRLKSRASVYRLVKSGDLTPVKIGDLKGLRFHQSDIADLIDHTPGTGDHSPSTPVDGGMGDQTGRSE